MLEELKLGNERATWPSSVANKPTEYYEQAFSSFDSKLDNPTCLAIHPFIPITTSTSAVDSHNHRLCYRSVDSSKMPLSIRSSCVNFSKRSCYCLWSAYFLRVFNLHELVSTRAIIASCLDANHLNSLTQYYRLLRWLMHHLQQQLFLRWNLCFQTRCNLTSLKLVSVFSLRRTLHTSLHFAVYQ